MTEAHPPIDPDDAAMIRRLAEMDMAAAEKAHAVLMAAADAAGIAAGLLAYQRAARSARQTLMLKARLTRMAFDITPRNAARLDALGGTAQDLAKDLAIGERIEALQDAVGRVAAAAHPEDAVLQEQLGAAHDALIDAAMERPDFLHHPLEALVLSQCEELELPRELAARWRELPKPPPRPLDDEIAAHDARFGDPPDRRESG
jgi:hypothetical protein